MTAEIVAFNSEGIAMATDSAVTSRVGGVDKISSSANKLFSISDRYHVGVMIYGNSMFMGIPWETIIKIYRSKYLPIDGFSTLDEYVKDFISFLNYKNIDFGNYADINYIRNFTDEILRIIRKKIKIKVYEYGDINITEKDLSILIKKVIDDEYKYYKTLKKEYISIDKIKLLFKRHNRRIKEYINLFFRDFPALDKESNNIVYQTIIEAFSKSILGGISSGIVVAGYGEKEFFPSVKALKIEGIVRSNIKDNEWEILKYDEDVDKSSSGDASAGVIPYAQIEMTCRFIEGVDPDYKQVEEEFLYEISSGFIDKIVKQLNKYNDKEKKEIHRQLSKYNKNMVKEFNDNMNKYIKEFFIDPTINAVERLTKNELASMAEALVYVTSLKRKVSPDSETVCEPIDVAVISKGDGFIWIRRKHYFDPALNPVYFMKRNKEILNEEQKNK
jgi:hypothetical protein